MNTVKAKVTLKEGQGVVEGDFVVGSENPDNITLLVFGNMSRTIPMGNILYIDMEIQGASA